MDIYELILEIGLRLIWNKKYKNSINFFKHQECRLRSPSILFFLEETYSLSLISSNANLSCCIYYFFEPKPKSLMNGNYSFWIVNFVMVEKDKLLIEHLVGFTKKTNARKLNINIRKGLTIIIFLKWELSSFFFLILNSSHLIPKGSQLVHIHNKNFKC